MRQRMVFSIGGFLAAAACGGASGPRPLAPVLATQQLYYDDGGGFPDSTRMVVRDQTTWIDIWARATYDQTSPPPVPAIDFNRDMILVAAAGRMRPGDRISVDSVGVRSNLFLVMVRVVQCSDFEADAYPVTIVRVPKDEKQVVFSETREQRSQCR